MVNQADGTGLLPMPGKYAGELGTSALAICQMICKRGRGYLSLDRIAASGAECIVYPQVLRTSGEASGHRSALQALRRVVEFKGDVYEVHEAGVGGGARRAAADFSRVVVGFQSGHPGRQAG